MEKGMLVKVAVVSVIISLVLTVVSLALQEESRRFLGQVVPMFFMVLFVKYVSQILNTMEEMKRTLDEIRAGRK